ncbi:MULTISPECIES: hypothetical protein [Zobellia]|uniref:Sensor of ECF-type sigma factor n=1 Tax=Zobellia galactanivorans (strain DSM 12802 / CCUG 47099 / CIP 106680 / NCIMB 13871 / Dsij) TaxID=63186 RepID=G0L8U1_ZOBGA|nr:MULTISPECIES: hypothetical protein [Zobellia]OWW24788.1 hypothetical protein B4Q04_13050 [Zobellia sp. OII3]CAZ94162.1 Conserved hypothetical protein [Zobellia galactanivorans]
MNRLKYIIIVLLLFVSAQFYAQKPHDYDKIKSLKIAFLTERLNLSSKEAQAFWPIYNEYENNRGKLREKEHTQVYPKVKEPEKLSEKEASAVVELFLEFEQKEEDIRKDFIKKAAGVITAKKTLLLLRSEEEFKRQLIRKYHQKRGESNKNRP